MKFFFKILLFIFINLLLISKTNANENYYFPLVDLGTIILSPKRAESSQGSFSENVSILTDKELENLPVKDLGEALNYIPGVDVHITNRFSQGTSLSIHGSESRQVLLMVDGIPFNTQLSGQANPSKIPIKNIKQIEVIKGAASSTWGSSMGGVINIITKNTGDSVIPKGSFTSTFAEFSTTENSIDLSGKVFNFGYYFFGNYYETAGVKSRSDVRKKNFFNKISYKLDDNLKITGSFGYDNAKIHDGINSNGKWYSTPFTTKYGKLSFDIKDDDFSGNISYKYNHQDITSETYNSLWILTNSTVSSNEYHGASLNGNFNIFDKNLLVMGADFDWHILKSNNYLSSSKIINMQSPYINYTLNFNNWTLIPGLRYDHNDKFGSQLSPSAGIIYNFNDKTGLIKFKISRAFNAPPLLWIYNDDPALWVGPNPNLKAERAVVIETGIEKNFSPRLKTSLNLYHMEIKDAIGTVFSGGVYMKENFRKFKRQGAELGINYKINKVFDLFGSAHFNDIKNNETNEIVRDQGIARQSFILGARLQNSEGYSANILASYNRWSSSPGLEANDRKFIIDAKLSKSFKNIKKEVNLEVFLNIYNLTNSKYWSDISYPLPERYFEGGFSFKF